MQRTATPCTPVRFRPQPPLLRSPPKICPGGEIGRRKGLKIPRWKHRAGSIPAPGTKPLFTTIHQKLFAHPHNNKVIEAV